MTSVSEPVDGLDPGRDSGFEVETTAADVLRARVRVAGRLGSRSVPLLVSVLGTHVRAGRRYLHVDLADARVDDRRALEPLRCTHTTITELGGQLIFDNAHEHADVLCPDPTLFTSA
jgi:hypothetical protein